MSATVLRPKRGFGPDDLYCPRCQGVRARSCRPAGMPEGLCWMPRPAPYTTTEYGTGWTYASETLGWRCGAQLVPAESAYRQEMSGGA